MQIFFFLMVQGSSQHCTHELCLVLFWVTRPRLTRSQWQEVILGIHSSFPWDSSPFPCTTLSCYFPSFICASVPNDSHDNSYQMAYAFVCLSVTFISKKPLYSHDLQLLNCSVSVLWGSSLSHQYKSEGFGVGNATARMNLILLASFLNSWPGF